MPRLPRIPSAMRYAAVVGVMMCLCAGVLLPSIANVREASSRSVCVCHIFCLGRGVQSFASTNQERLPGHAPWMPLQPNKLTPEKRFSWQVDVLPYIAEDTAYKLFDRTAANDDPKNREAMSERL